RLSPLSSLSFLCLPSLPPPLSSLFFFIVPAPTEIYTLSLHDALPICLPLSGRFVAVFVDHLLHTLPHGGCDVRTAVDHPDVRTRSEEHTSELQSRFDLVCRLLLEKKKKEQHTQPRRCGQRKERTLTSM